MHIPLPVTDVRKSLTKIGKGPGKVRVFWFYDCDLASCSSHLFTHVVYSLRYVGYVLLVSLSSGVLDLNRGFKALNYQNKLPLLVTLQTPEEAVAAAALWCRGTGEKQELSASIQFWHRFLMCNWGAFCLTFPVCKMKNTTSTV